MKLIPALSTHVFAFRALDEDLIGIAAAAGFRAVEIFAAPQHLDIRDARRAVRLCGAIEREGMRLLAIHAPFYEDLDGLYAGRFFSLGDPAPESRARAAETVRTLMPLAAEVGSPHIVLHAGHPVPERPRIDILIEEVDRAASAAGDFTGRLLLENTPRTGLAIADLAAVGDALDAERTGFCIDVGHLNLEAPLSWENDDDLFRVLERTHHFHVHDNHGQKDEHLPPGKGSIDWEAMAERLGGNSAAHTAGFALELRDSSRGERAADEVLHESLDGVSGPVLRLLQQEGIRP